MSECLPLGEHAGVLIPRNVRGHGRAPRSCIPHGSVTAGHLSSPCSLKSSTEDTGKRFPVCSYSCVCCLQPPSRGSRGPRALRPWPAQHSLLREARPRPAEAARFRWAGIHARRRGLWGFWGSGPRVLVETGLSICTRPPGGETQGPWAATRPPPPPDKPFPGRRDAGGEGAESQQGACLPPPQVGRPRPCPGQSVNLKDTQRESEEMALEGPWGSPRQDRVCRMPARGHRSRPGGNGPRPGTHGRSLHVSFTGAATIGR